MADVCVVMLQVLSALLVMCLTQYEPGDLVCQRTHGVGGSITDARAAPGQQAIHGHDL